MTVMFSARRLQPGAWDKSGTRGAPGDALPPGFQRAYHPRNIRGEDEINPFGVFDMTEEDYHRWRAEADAEETQRIDHLQRLWRTITSRVSRGDRLARGADS